MNYKFEKPVAGEIGQEKYRCSITWRNGKLIADEPESAGGKDLGPDPYSLMLSSVVSCILITLRMYIDRKGWDIPAISVESNLYQNVKDDKAVTIIDEDIKFLSPVTDEQREKLISIAKACPISKILQGEILIRTFVYDGAETEKQIKYHNEDIIVVWKLDRLARSTRDLLNTIETIDEAGSKFQSISEPWANTTTHAGKMIMTVFAGIAEFERDLIRERTGAGREAAKQRGVRFGRPRKLNPDQAQVATQLLAEGKAVGDIARTFNVHEATIYRLAAAS